MPAAWLEVCIVEFCGNKMNHDGWRPNLLNKMYEELNTEIWHHLSPLTYIACPCYCHISNWATRRSKFDTFTGTDSSSQSCLDSSELLLSFIRLLYFSQFVHTTAATHTSHGTPTVATHKPFSIRCWLKVQLKWNISKPTTLVDNWTAHGSHTTTETVALYPESRNTLKKEINNKFIVWTKLGTLRLLHSRCTFYFFVVYDIFVRCFDQQMRSESARNMVFIDLRKT